MKSILKGILIATGVLLLAFAINLTAYMAVPSYKNTLKNIVNSNMDDAGKSDGMKEIGQTAKEKTHQVSAVDDTEGYGDTIVHKEYQSGTEAGSVYEPENAQTDAVKKTAEPEKKPIIIDKEYHEDCGTGKGYWIIKYEDGTIEIE